jgi:hypothetical protein
VLRYRFIANKETSKEKKLEKKTIVTDEKRNERSQLQVRRRTKEFY